jgi:hypothetical protein
LSGLNTKLTMRRFDTNLPALGECPGDLDEVGEFRRG